MIKPVLHYFNLADEVVSFSTTRHGGVSKGKLATLNINPHRGDEPPEHQSQLLQPADSRLQQTVHHPDEG